MASSSENDDTSSTDDNEDLVFYDANSSWTNVEVNPLFPPDARWALLSKNDPPKKPEQFCTITLTESQLNDIARRDKLQRLRAQEDHANRNNENPIITIISSPIESNSILSSTTLSSIQSNQIEEQQSINENESSASDLLKDHIDSDHVRRQKMVSLLSVTKQTLINSSPIAQSYQQQRSLPYPTLPVATSTRNGDGYFSRLTNLSAISEPNIVDLNLVDCMKKIGEFSPNHQKFNGNQRLRKSLLHNLDNGKYITLSDANPMTQTILERVHGSNSMITLRQTSILNNNNIRQNSSDSNSLNGTNSLETNIPRQRHKSNGDEYDDNESTSSESSSTKSSHTIAISLSSSPINKSSAAALRVAASLFHDGKRQLSRLVNRSFLRKNGKKFLHGHNDVVDMDEEEEDGERLLINDGSNGDLKYKSRNLKEQPQFDKTQLLQTIVNAHNGPIWCMKFSPDGQLLATGGQDSLLKVWVLKSAQPHFDDFSRMTADPSKQQNEILTRRFHEFHQTISSESITPTINSKLGLNEMQAPLYPRPFCQLNGHQAPVLDVAWSKSLFLLSSSMDKTVRLWHLSRLECLCFFRHVDFVSAIAFHPRDDRYFVSASLDGHVRLWNIPDKRVVYWTLIPAQASSQITAAQANLITAVNFCDDGRKVIVGTFDGRFLLYTDSLQYDTVMNIGDEHGSRNHRSRKKRRKPYKITGIESMNSNSSKVLITSNDSRIRLYDIRTKEIERKYRGYSNQSSQIRASFSHDDRYIISGSEDSWFYIWRTEPSTIINTNGSSTTDAKLTRKQRRHFDRVFERIRVHNTMVTSAIFAPNPNSIMDHLYSSNLPLISDSLSQTNRSNNSSNLPRSASTTISTATPIVNSSRARFICVHAASSPLEVSSTTNNNGPIYVMVTADSKGQLKLLVNRFHR
ncbi:unnamed protein product [Rotaria magnacalcarata]|uniref:WD repeat-containing protein 44 n=7 Tax=Rotaria magnacalcarata TaxID=392030 RepID=A0A815XXZ3_9BILA|nr:unnamed protein product [Rotaria magnacalcarata]CAF1668005.1 unnamed protein product [Rotaria magnacalcarata]CAF2075271.1 unnamed protein product [Rotaria magnacalcarata]CAF2126458.1 unnamed protein product [Rotaria magnacalcarata]CAF2198128.1 unnamed protein product [Rotaria magnacalcarata]